MAQRLNQVGVALLLCILMLWGLPPASAQEEDVTHVVQPGENLFRIALRYGVDMNALAQANGITNASYVYSGQTLVIPGLTQPAQSEVTQEANNPLVATAPILHTIQRGETLRDIATVYGVTVEQLMQANNIVNPDRILAGQELQIWTSDLSATEETAAEAPAEAAPEAAASNASDSSDEEAVPDVEAAADEMGIVGVEANSSQTIQATHIVQRGEYLSQIASRYGVPWTRIAEANGIVDPNRVYAGLELIIPGAVQAATGSTGYEIQTITEANAPGPRVGVGRELVVKLSTQMAYAYEDGVLQRSALVSTGLPATPTVQGDYAIYRKYDSQTMSGPGYYLPGVPWVMYFYQGYAFHGTYWHENFGQPMSHGCVNMTNEDARWFYDFASIGTPVHVQW